MPFFDIGEIGKTIRSERGRRLMSRADLAEASGIPAATLATYEQGKSAPSIENLWKLADVFNLTIGVLCGRDEKDCEPVQ